MHVKLFFTFPAEKNIYSGEKISEEVYERPDPRLLVTTNEPYSDSTGLDGVGGIEI
jgi:hypothetical protein